MLNPFRAPGAALRDLLDEFLLLIVCNLIWAVMSLPLWGLAVAALGMNEPALALAAALLGVLPAGPATAGLFHVAYRVTDGRAIKLADFFAGMRRQARLGLTLTAIAVAGLLVIIFNLGFYLGMNSMLGGVMLGLWLYLLLFWLGLILYAYPLIFLLEQPGMRLIGRNALLMSIGRPLFTIVTLLLMGVVLLISFVLVVPLALITLAFFAVWATHATRTVIDDARRRREAAEAQAAAPAAPSDEQGRKGQVRPK